MSKKEGGKNRKIDRNRKSNQNLRYKTENRHNKSHIARLKRHLEKFPGDWKSSLALERFTLRSRPT